MIRFIIIVLIVLLYLILGIPVLLIEWVIGKINRRARDYSSLRLVQAAFKLIMFATGVKLTVIGEENVPSAIYSPPKRARHSARKRIISTKRHLILF